MDLLIYAVHGLFWAAFGITRAIAQRGAKTAAPPESVNTTARTAPGSRGLLALHMAAFGLMYYGVAKAVLRAGVPVAFPGQALVGTAVIAIGGALMCWSLLHFRSWRFRAQLDPGHQLATTGPFAIVRHPIYAGLNLLALGTAVWVPLPVIFGALALMFVGGDLRGRAEEKLLLEAFPDEYRRYTERTKRFVPGVY